MKLAIIKRLVSATDAGLKVKYKAALQQMPLKFQGSKAAIMEKK